MGWWGSLEAGLAEVEVEVVEVEVLLFLWTARCLLWVPLWEASMGDGPDVFVKSIAPG